jgi:enoyl-CoA hydratase/carnithine racemase
MEIAETVCQRGPLGIRATKEAIIRGYDMTLPDGLYLEAEKVAYVRTTDDFMEGARAFARKRTPDYKGK